jgi:hypothetical protein
MEDIILMEVMVRISAEDVFQEVTTLEKVVFTTTEKAVPLFVEFGWNPVLYRLDLTKTVIVELNRTATHLQNLSTHHAIKMPPLTWRTHPQS